MNDEDVIKRLRTIADEHDGRADSHYRKARGSKRTYIQDIERSYGTAERSDAIFLRELSDAIEHNMPSHPVAPVFDSVRG